MDLGLVVSNDGLQFAEPIPDFQLVSAYEVDRRHHAHPQPCLEQGQGFENVGEETLFWYAPWPEQLSNGVRVASWQRDRLGYFQASDLNLNKGQVRHVISAPIDLEGQLTQVWLNVDGLSQHAQIAVEILDEHFQPIDGYLAQECQPLESGLRQPVH